MTAELAVYLPPLNRQPNNRVRLRLPFGDARWRSWLKGQCGALTRPDFEREPVPVWTVARPHFATVMRALARKYGVVPVITEHNEAHHCTVACQSASSGPEMCECVCGGSHHGGDGGGGDWAHVAGDLLVARNVYRREFFCTFDGDAFTYLDSRLSTVGAPR